MGEGTMSINSTTISVTIEDALATAAEKCAADCGFANVEELIVYLLRGALRVEDKALDDQELALVEKRLHDLGYLD